MSTAIWLDKTERQWSYFLVSFRNKRQFSQEKCAFLLTTSGQNSQYKVIIRKTFLIGRNYKIRKSHQTWVGTFVP